MPTPKEDFQSKLDANNKRKEINNRLKGKLQEEVDRLKLENENLDIDNQAYEAAIIKLDEMTKPQPETETETDASNSKN